MNRHAAFCVRWLWLGIFLLAISCASVEPMRQVETTLYFGLRKPDGSLVSNKQWHYFVDTEIAPRFPKGFTIIDGQGQWLGVSEKPVQEPAKIVKLIRNNSGVEDREINAIIRNYKHFADQESVLRTDQPVSAAF